MYFDNQSEKYFEEIDDACEWYWDEELDPAEVPEFIYGTKDSPIDRRMASNLTGVLIDHIDNHVPELCAEDSYYSDTLTDSSLNHLIEDIRAALQKTINMLEPDYGVKEPFREAYIKYTNKD